MSDSAIKGRCKDCVFATPFCATTGRIRCTNNKVFGIDGTAEDGADEWEAAEISFGPEFGCIHFKEKS